MSKKSTMTSTKTSTITNTMVAVAVLILGSASLVAAAALTYFPSKDGGKMQLAGNAPSPASTLPASIKQVTVKIGGDVPFVLDKKKLSYSGSLVASISKGAKNKNVRVVPTIENPGSNLQYGFLVLNDVPFGVNDLNPLFKTTVVNKIVWSNKSSYTFLSKEDSPKIFILIKNNDQVFKFPNLKLDDALFVNLQKQNTTSTTP